MFKIHLQTYDNHIKFHRKYCIIQQFFFSWEMDMDIFQNNDFRLKFTSFSVFRNYDWRPFIWDFPPFPMELCVTIFFFKYFLEVLHISPAMTCSHIEYSYSRTNCTLYWLFIPPSLCPPSYTPLRSGTWLISKVLNLRLFILLMTALSPLKIFSRLFIYLFFTRFSL